MGRCSAARRTTNRTMHLTLILFVFCYTLTCSLTQSDDYSAEENPSSSIDTPEKDDLDTPDSGAKLRPYNLIAPRPSSKTNYI